MRGEARRQDGGMTRGREGSVTTGDSTTSWHDKRTRGWRDQTTSVLKFIIPLVLVHKFSEWLLFDSEPIQQSWRSDDQSTVTIFLHSIFLGLGKLWCRMSIQMKWLFNLCFGDTPLMQAFESTIFTSTSSVPMQLVVLNRWPSTKRFHFNFLMEKPHFVWKWARWAATRRCS
jgi:hypothetical protein